MPKDDDIVIVGVGCKFPGANNLKEFWRVLSKGENHVKEVPKERWNIDAFYDPDPDAPGKTYVRKAGFIQGIDEWDHRCYDINDMEAELVDPQQRLVLDCVHMALEDGGITRNNIEKTDTAVYIGSMTDDYKGHVMGDNTIASTYTVTGTHNSIISARVSYVYNLLGPALTIDTACSSSLVAIDVASQAIAAGKCTAAICGGVNVLLDPQLFIALAKARMLSPTGQCQTFTANNNGYARGEGCGIVILKTFKDALRDGNKIWGTIKTETNQDGNIAKPITAPSEEQQKNMIEQLYKRVDMNKGNISVIEAHGTGTPVGDPTEVSALGAHFGRSSRAPSDVFIGSVKTNIGHLEAAAGVAGLIKVLLMMKYEMVVPSLWYTKENENPKLKLSALGFRVPTECVLWKAPSGKGRIACVNSFGFGGTNAHAIVEQYTNKKEMSHTTTNIHILPYRLVTISAFDESSLVKNAHVFCDALDEVDECDLDALSYTSTCRRDHRPIRKAVHGLTVNEVKLSLRNYLNAPEDSSTSKTKYIVFVYCGVGTAWNGMCASLIKLPAFRNAIDQIDKYLEPLTKWRIADIFKESRDVLADPFVSHLAIFACQVGLTALWKIFGIQPMSVVGQSVGEVAAALASGFLTLKDAVNIIYFRSKLLASVNKGKMAVVRNLDTKLVQKHCESIGAMRVAVFTSDSSCTVSGDERSIQKLKDMLKTTDADILDIDVKCAYHSQFVEEAAKELAMKLRNIEKQTGKIPMFSTVTGAKETNGLFNTPDYWKKNVEKPVAFSTAIKESVEGNDHVIFVEIGPSPVLKSHIERILTEKSIYTVLPSLKKKDDTKTLAGTICSLYELGIDLKWSELSPQINTMTDVPVYQSRKYKQLHISNNAIMRMQGAESQGSTHLYIKHLAPKDERAYFSIVIDETATPFVFEHIVSGFYIVPGATYADIGFEIGRSLLGLPKTDVSISLEFLRPVKVDKGVKSTLNVSTLDQKDNIMFHLSQGKMAMCKGWVHSILLKDKCSKRMDVDKLKVAISSRGCRTLSEDDMYGNLQSMGFQHGSCFRMMKESLTNGVESLTEISVPDDVMNQLNRTTIHACILDTMMQTTINTTTEELLTQIEHEKLSFLPVAIGEIRILQEPEQRMFAYTRRINTTVLDTVFQVHYNILLFDLYGKVIADLRNYTTYGKRNNSMSPCELRYQLTWQPAAIPRVETTDAPRILVLTNTHENTTKELFQNMDNLTLFQPRNEENATFIQKAFSEKNYDSVILLIHEFTLNKEVDYVAATELHRLIKYNCMLLTDVVTYMTEKRIVIPLFVVTQNSQPTFPTQSPLINLVGAELWGFVRSVHLEFIHGPITLVDVRPTIKETKDTLLQLISNTFQNINNLKPELLIDTDQEYGGQFTKDPRCHMIPFLRAEHKIPRKLVTPHKVLTKRSDGTQLSCLVEDDISVDKVRSDHINIHVKSICSHPLTMLPRTTEGLKQDPDAWEESMNEGYQLFGLEYTGYPSIPTKKVTCRTPKVQDEIACLENEWEYVCIWPTEMNHKMSVPKSNLVNLKEIGGRYEPGLLLYSVISWLIVNLVPQRASVVVYSRSPNSLQRNVLVDMLGVRKHAYIIDPIVESRSTGKQIDVLISFEKVDSSFFLAKYCKDIICLNGNIPETLMIEMTRLDSKPKITSLDLINLLKTKAHKVLQKAVSWLQKWKARVISMPSDISPVIELMQTCVMKLPARRPLNQLFVKSGIYIITGGLTGLGWEMAQLFAEMGAGVIVLLTRRPALSEQLKDINNLETKTGTRIICISADVTNYASVQSAVKEIRNQVKGCEIKGVFHGAGVLNGKLLVNLEESQLEEVLNPKVIGTLNMHIATREFDLDYFVVPSSINSLIGSPGQSSYGAANSFMDTFIEWRRRRGLSGQSINWGALCVGMASRKEFVENFEKRGFNLLTKLEIRSCLQEVLMQNSTSVIYTEVNWDIAAKDFENPNMARPKLQMNVLFEQVTTSEVGSENTEIIDVSFDVDALNVAGEEIQMKALAQVVDTLVSKVIGGDTHHVKGKSTLDEIGFDSMSKVTFINLVRTITGYQIAAKFMADTSHTYDDLIQELFKGLFVDAANLNDST